MIVEVEDEKAIPVVRKGSEFPVSLSDESEIIKNLTKPINIIRIYAKKDVYDKAKKLYDNKVKDSMGL